MPLLARILARIIAIAALGVALTAAAQSPTLRIRGDVVALDGNTLQVKTRAGEALTVRLTDNFGVSAIVKRDLAAVVPGTFIGTATMQRPDGTLQALEVLIFPEAMRGSGEGHYAWDLQQGSMMTNATVFDVVSVDAARRLTLKYKDGEKVVVVPPDAPVVTFEPGDRAMLVPGAHIMLGAAKQPDGSLTAGRVSVGKDGLVPPM
jgi:RNase P/RNase MRP subunit p29